MPASFEFWFDFGSTYSYPAAMRLRRVVGPDMTILWRPFLLGAIFKQQNLDTSPFVHNPAKGRYMWRDLERVCASLDLPFVRPSVFPRNGLLPARIACEFNREPWMEEFIRRVFTANFVADRDIGNPEEVGGLLNELGLDADSIIAKAQTDASKQRLRAQTERAAQLGIFGAPTIRVGDEMFWGNDRVEQAVAWFRRTAGQH